MKCIREAMEDPSGLATEPTPAKPVLKWAGGKRQMLPQLRRVLPASFDRYVEPMIGGGAVFFALSPKRALIADRNPELVNFYRVLASDPEGLIAAAASWMATEETFYKVRALPFNKLDPVTAAARTLFLNRTCFNGLYRVNRRGEFNVPWGRYAKPVVVNESAIRAASRALAAVPILLGDYEAVLREHAREGDLIFLDPPYMPISEYSDFKRYTKEQFRETDHQAMRDLVLDLRLKGCTTIITNSNHPFIHDLYRGFPIEVFTTKRNINSRGSGRVGEDIIVLVEPERGH